MPNLQQLEKWITTGEAARRLGKTRQGVTWMLENRRLRGVRTALGWLVDPEAVEDLADSEEIAEAKRAVERGEDEVISWEDYKAGRA